MPLAAWTPDTDRPFGVHAPALDLSQVTEVEELIQQTGSVLLSKAPASSDSPVDRARAAIEALGGEIVDPEARRASGRVIVKYARRVDVPRTGSGRPPLGF